MLIIILTPDQIINFILVFCMAEAQQHAVEDFLYLVILLWEDCHHQMYKHTHSQVLKLVSGTYSLL